MTIYANYKSIKEYEKSTTYIIKTMTIDSIIGINENVNMRMTYVNDWEPLLTIRITFPVSRLRW